MSIPIEPSSKVPLPSSESTGIPILGFGVYRSDQNVCKKSCLTALKTGYRHIDTAQYYANEEEVGQAVKESGLDRSEVFITTKILSAGGSYEKSLAKVRESVKKLDPRGDGGYVDLFLIHSPHCGKDKRKEMWEALETLLQEGKTKAIGVSNFSSSEIEEMKGYAKVWPPACNQIELHPWCQQKPTVAYCAKNKIPVTAYAPVVRNQKAAHEGLLKIGKQHNKTASQILIRYSLQKMWIPLPKSDTPSRIEENYDVWDFSLSEEEMKEMDSWDQGEKGAIVEYVYS